MLAVVKTPHTNITLEGEIPTAVLNVVKEYFGKVVKITPSEDDEYVDVFETQWLKGVRKSMTPGDSIRANRELMGWTQVELGKKLSRSRQYVSDLEHGRRSVSKEMVKELAQIFKTSADAFL